MNELEKYIIENDRDNISAYLEVVSIDDFIIDIKRIMAKKQDSEIIKSAINYLKSFVNE